MEILVENIEWATNPDKTTKLPRFKTILAPRGMKKKKLIEYIAECLEKSHFQKPKDFKIVNPITGESFSMSSN